ATDFQLSPRGDKPSPNPSTDQERHSHRVLVPFQYEKMATTEALQCILANTPRCQNGQSSPEEGCKNMTNKLKRLLHGGLACGALLVISLPAMATPISGKLALDGRFTFGPTFLNFCDSTVVGDCPAAPGNWNPPTATLPPAI